MQKTGAHQRTRHLFNALKQTAHVDVLFFNLYDKDVPVTDSHVFMYDVDLEAGTLSKLKGCVPFGQHVIALKNGRCSRIYREMIQRRKYDVVVFRYLATAVMCGVEDYADVVIDIDDIPWHNYHKMAENPSYSWIKRVYFGYKSWGIKRVASRIMKRCRLYYTANPQDCLTDNSRYLPNIPAILESQDYVSGCNKTYCLSDSWLSLPIIRGWTILLTIYGGMYARSIRTRISMWWGKEHRNICVGHGSHTPMCMYWALWTI